MDVEGSDHDRWLRGMRRYQATLLDASVSRSPRSHPLPTEELTE